MSMMGENFRKHSWGKWTNGIFLAQTTSTATQSKKGHTPEEERRTNVKLRHLVLNLSIAI